MGDRKLTLADQALVNVAFALHLADEGDPNWTMLAEIAAELRPAVSDEHPKLGPLIGALDARIAEARRPITDRADRWRVDLDLKVALRDFAWWRGGMALDAHRAAQERAA